MINISGLRGVQKKFLDSLPFEKKFVFVNAPTGSGKTLMGLMFLKYYGGGYVFVRTRNQLSSFVRDSVQFFNELPEVYMNKRVSCFYARKRSVILDDDLPVCQRCRYNFLDPGFEERVKGWMIEKKNYDPYAVPYDEKYGCPYVNWRRDKEVVIATYGWVFEDWLRKMFVKWMEKKIAVFDESHNLDDVGLRVYGVFNKRYVKKLKEAMRYYGGLGFTLGRYDGFLELLSNVKYEEGKIVDEKWIEDLKAWKKPVVDYLNEMKKDFRKKAKEKLKNGDQAGAVVLSGYLTIVRRMIRFMEALDRLGGSVLAVYRNNHVEIVDTDTKWISKILDEMFDRVLFLSGTMPSREYIKNVWGFEDFEYIDYSNMVFGRKRSRVYPGVTSKWENRNDNVDKYADFIRQEYLWQKKYNPGVVLVVFPSYSMMKNVYENYVKKYGSGDIIVEERDSVLGMVLERVKKNEMVMVFTVFGGKFVEGIEFIDADKKRSLVKKVIIAGIPYEKPSELNEMVLKNNGLDRWFYLNNKALIKVKQALGRAIRFENDSVDFVYADKRFLTRFWKKVL